MPYINRKKVVKQKPTPYVHHSNQSHKYYNTKQWVNLRNYYIKQHPFCERCEAQGRTTLATQVHHQVPFLNGLTETERLNLLLDEDNLMSVCNKCHAEIHNEMNRKKYDDQGDDCMSTRGNK